MSEFCIHYPNGGMAENKVCKKGVAFETLKGIKNTAPCFDNKAIGCVFVEYPTSEQIAEQEKYLAHKLSQMGDFMAHKTDICFLCGKQVNTLRHVGQCVYGSCGCRMWQGKIPKEWQSSASSI